MMWHLLHLYLYHTCKQTCFKGIHLSTSWPEREREEEVEKKRKKEESEKRKWGKWQEKEEKKKEGEEEAQLTCHRQQQTGSNTTQVLFLPEWEKQLGFLEKIKKVTENFWRKIRFSSILAKASKSGPMSFERRGVGVVNSKLKTVPFQPFRFYKHWSCCIMLPSYSMKL